MFEIINILYAYNTMLLNISGVCFRINVVFVNLSSLFLK